MKNQDSSVHHKIAVREKSKGYNRGRGADLTQNAAGCVYFLTDGEAIKIGFATNLKKRIDQLQGGHHFPLFLLGSIPAPRRHERMIHSRFRGLRIRGEWFQIHDDILAYIDTVPGWVEGHDMEEYGHRVSALGQRFRAPYCQ